MMDLNKVLHEFQCDDCALVFSDYKHFLRHRKDHSSLLRSAPTENTLLEEDCLPCVVKHSQKYKFACFGKFAGSGHIMKERKVKTKLQLRCKYYPKCNKRLNRICDFIKHSKEVHNDGMPFACQKCDFSTRLYINLKRHLFRHLGFKTLNFKCHLCPKEYASSGALSNHLLICRKEGNKTSHDCSYCDERFTSLIALKRHLQLHCRNLLKCQLCSKHYFTQATFNNHLETHDKILKCHKCPKKCAEERKLQRHLAQMHSDVRARSCYSCGKEFAETYSLNSHLKQHASSDLLKCHLCFDQFHSRAALAVHRKTHFEMHQCYLCPKAYESRREFNSHLSSVHHEREVENRKCSYCDKTFSSYPRLSKHLILHFPTSCKCHLCSKKFSRQTDAENSSQNQLDERVHIKCHLCSEEFEVRTKLKRHIFLRHKEESTQCSNCNDIYLQCKDLTRDLIMDSCVPSKPSKRKVFPTTKSLEHLLNDKADERESYDCSCCGNKFTTFHDLKGHLRMHLPNPKTTQCDLCLRQFPQKSTLEIHIRAHYKWFNCHLCPKVFLSVATLNAHLSSHKEANTKSYDCDRKLLAPGELQWDYVNLNTPTSETEEPKKISEWHPFPSEYKSRDSQENSHKVVNIKSEDFDRKLPAPSELQLDLREAHAPTSETKQPNKIFKCHLCPKECKSEDGLAVHLFSSHKEANIKTFDCSYCDRKFAFYSRLEWHLEETHLSTSKSKEHRSGATNHTTSLPSSPFAELSSKNELENQDKARLFCNYVSTKQDVFESGKAGSPHFQAFKNFVIRKTNEDGFKSLNSARHDKKPFGCTDCGQTFQWETSLQKHRDAEKHSKNPLDCHKCAKTFKNSNCLTYHERSHKELFCEICNSRYYTALGFKKHLASHGITDNTDMSSQQAAKKRRNDSAKQLS